MDALIEKFLPGVAAMANVHPLFVHFPIALLSSFLAMEFLGVVLRREELRAAASWMLYLGTLGAGAAVAAGLWAADTVAHSPEVHPLILMHRNLQLTVLLLAVMLSVWRLYAGGRFSAKAQLMHLLVAFLMVTVLSFGADRGGLMVYKYGVGVAAVKQPLVHTHSLAAMPAPKDAEHGPEDQDHEHE